MASLIAGKLDQANPPETINVTGQLKKGVDKHRITGIKTRLNQARKIVPMAWILPVLIFGAGMAFSVRSLKDLKIWAAWPLFATGLIGTIFARFISNPQLLLENALMPPPPAMPAPAAPIVMSVLRDPGIGSAHIPFGQTPLVPIFMSDQCGLRLHETTPKLDKRDMEKEKPRSKPWVQNLILAFAFIGVMLILADVGTNIIHALQ